MTAGKGIVHAEMFPLLKTDADNPLELFQIWLNLPKRNKMVEPHFSMLWREAIPKFDVVDGAGKKTSIAIVAGSYGEHIGPTPPPSSWASQPDAKVSIWTLKLEAGATFTLPASAKGLNRSLYFFIGEEARVDDVNVEVRHRLVLESDADVTLEAGDAPCEFLLLEGRPIGEVVVQYGPFVMNTPQEIEAAYRDFQRTRFGGWPWPSTEPVHAKAQGRFAKHADGRVETKET